ncbi:MAG: dihydroorotate dehydrogenase electron transfer subunit [Pseudomonadota bacterium]
MYREDMMIEASAKIVFNREVNPETFLMGLKSAAIAREARPGQFVMVRVGSGMDPLLRRPFSVFGIEGDIFLILYRVVGRGTAVMADCREGERLSVLGPLGRGFEMPDAGFNALLVGGGMGVAPLFFLARKLGKGKFMMGFGTSREVIRPDLKGALQVDVSIATDDGTEGHPGFVTDLLEDALGKTPREKADLQIFACGPMAMLKKVAAKAMHHDIPCQASLEASMACGLGACQGCAVPASPREKKAYFHVCQDGPVFPADRLDWDKLAV